jgi:hypothetical protein
MKPTQYDHGCCNRQYVITRIRLSLLGGSNPRLSLEPEPT